MSVAAAADHLCAHGKEVSIFAVGDILGIDRTEKTGPASSRLILRFRAVKRKATTGAHIGSFLLLIAIGVIVGALSTRLSEHFELLWREPLFPFSLGEDHLFPIKTLFCQKGLLETLYEIGLYKSFTEYGTR